MTTIRRLGSTGLDSSLRGLCATEGNGPWHTSCNIIDLLADLADASLAGRAYMVHGTVQMPDRYFTIDSGKCVTDVLTHGTNVTIGDASGKYAFCR